MERDASNRTDQISPLRQHTGDGGVRVSVTVLKKRVVRERAPLVAPKPPLRVLLRGQAGLVINKHAEVDHDFELNDVWSL